MSDLTEQNKERLVKVIEKPVDRMSDWSAERKLKQFYQACNDMYTREKMRGRHLTLRKTAEKKVKFLAIF